MNHPGGRSWRRGARHLLLAAAAFVLGGCAAHSIPAAVLPLSASGDRAAGFQSLISGEHTIPLAAPESPWQTAAEPPATVEIGPDGMRLVSLPGQRAWASPRLPVAPLDARLDASPPVQLEELMWEAAITLEQRFFIVCELRFAGEPGALLIQATPFDIQVLQDPERPGGGGATSQSISRLVGDGRAHFWRLRLDSARSEIRLDGSTVWSLDGARLLARVAFGETRSDSLHGGSMLLRDVVYVRRPA